MLFRSKSDIDEVISIKDRKGVLGYLLCAKEAQFRQLPEIGYKKDPSSYDLVIIGTPVWTWTMSSPIRTYLTKNRGRFKKLAFFCTMGGSGSEAAFKHMEKICGIKPIATLALTTKEVIDNKHLSKAKEFVNKLS